MPLKEFNFINQSVELLDILKPTLDMLSVELEEYFKEILNQSNVEYLNASSRVKSKDSLREKIIRNRYIKKYNTSEELIHNLSDLIGIRLECRFIEDETKLFKLLKKYFNKTEDKVYYYNKRNEKIKLKLSERQPQKQKNGLQIYRIDGKFDYGDKIINFEIQIKSLVNIFWSEIEHKIIYKNNTYLIADNFLNDIMLSIKSNLTMIDNQLLTVYDNFHTSNKKSKNVKMKNTEKFIAKMIYDTFAEKMLNSIGFIVDFKIPCETIINYSFSKMATDDDTFGDMAVKALSRINEIDKKEIDFNSKINFEAEPVYEDEISKTLGQYMVKKLNYEFTWNLFFRILFEIEPYNNKKDFENFIVFIKDNMLSEENICKLEEKFSIEESKIVLNNIYKVVVDTLIEVDTIEFIYVDNFYKIDELLGKEIDNMFKEVNNYEMYIEQFDKFEDNIKCSIKKLFK
ncbi:GTP pyrophosphokinase [Romboutsia sp.]|uniref:GTP pyrophosphokinase n=1 Tax=Romboutsia sp. TaxID=1965302 RepID=UPI003F3E3170